MSMQQETFEKEVLSLKTAWIVHSIGIWTALYAALYCIMQGDKPWLSIVLLVAAFFITGELDKMHKAITKFADQHKYRPDD